MLAEVEICDFAIVESARVRLGPGFCVLSGETGAGKSLVIDAIAALLGERGRTELIRSGADSARLRAVFDLGDVASAAARLADLGVEPDPDGLCIITREIRATGRGRCTINGSLATVAMLRQLGEALIDIHGQHEHQSLLRVREHLGLLDAVGGETVGAARAAYSQVYERWREVREAIAALCLDEGEKARRADMLRYQVDEIGNARLEPGEDDELNAERSRLAHAERLLTTAAKAHDALAGSEEGVSAVDQVGAALEAVREMAEFDASLGPLAEELESAFATIREAARSLADYAAELEADPRRLDEVEERLDLLERLERKYGEGIAAILEFGRRAADELETIETAAERLGELEAERAGIETELAKVGAGLTKARCQAAGSLASAVEAHLRDLGMTAVEFSVSITPRQAGDETVEVDGQRVGVTADGLDEVEFLFSANPGEPARPLASIASGGELARVMLALKSELAESDSIPTLIFDEIDAGIGGVTIHHAGRKMAGLSRRRQVVCVTHHAPIAALADVHIAVEKPPDAEATTVVVRGLEGDERVYELARMLGRQPPTDATLAMARELLSEVGR